MTSILRDIPTNIIQQQMKDNHQELHNLLEEDEIVKIKEVFDKEYGKKLNREQLKEVLVKIARIEYDDQKFNLIFLRMNSQW